MIKHIALFRFHEGTSDAAIDAFGAALDAMVPQVGLLRTYEHGRDLAATDGTFDYAVIAGLDSIDDYRTYASHPAHVSVIEHHSSVITAESVRVQVEV
jgi:hypothetical protein